MPEIAKRVRFWEEQERINQVLVPKVIRQHELLTKHIEEHDNLHERFRREISTALEKLQKRACEHEEDLRRRLSAAVEKQARRPVKRPAFRSRPALRTMPAP